MKTTTVRKLLPESWGFLCPVHTPDGSPCGLLNHISLSCAPLPSEEIDSHLIGDKLKKLLCQLGMNPIGTEFGLIYPSKYLPIMLDGKLMGYVDPKVAPYLVKSLRAIKIIQNKADELHACVPKTMEIAFMASSGSDSKSENSEKSTSGSEGDDHKEKFYPGVFLFTTPARFVRPVQNLEHGGIEFIGPLEQVNLSVACLEEDLRSDSTH
jgi:DNA-directed RNA polymerase I subunit RPA2